MSNTFLFKNNLIGVGDKVKVVQKILESGKERKQIFLGTIIQIKGDSQNKAITVRRIGANLVGIEKIYPLNNPSLEEITVTKEGHKGSRSAKLFYIRHKSKKQIDKIYSRSKRKKLIWFMTGGNFVEKGKNGEYFASCLLEKEGFKVIGNNFRSAFGEIDIIATKGGTHYFCEVKTRWNTHYGYPEESVTRKKLRKIIKTVEYYLNKNNITNINYQIIVIAQIIDNGKLYYQKLIYFD